MKYFAVFASSASLSEFRLAELATAAATLGIEVTILDDAIPWMRSGAQDSAQSGDAVWFAVFESAATYAELQALAQRCVLLRAIYVLFESAPTLEDLCTSLDQRYHQCRGDSYHGPSNASAASSSPPPPPHVRVFLGEDAAAHIEGAPTFSYEVETIGKKYTGEAKRAVVDAVLQRVPQQGDVNWRTPGRRYAVFLQHAVENAPAGAQGWVSDGPLLRVLHGCLCAVSQRSALLATYDLRRRPYIGTTSMPPEESLLMANLAGVRPGHYVYDPFCGTGSLLVAAAHYGARTMGSDADGRAMRAGTEKGKTSPQMQQQRQLAFATYSAAQLARVTPEERELPSMLTNFKVYGLAPPDRARMNFSAWARTWHSRNNSNGGGEAGIFDSIISDPPYGLREPRKKVEAVGSISISSSSEQAQASPTASGKSATAPPSAVAITAYATDEVVLDLVLFAATHLVVGGRLAFWHPTTDHYTSEELPTHPSLRIVSDVAQRVSLKVVRRLVVMCKVAPVPHPPPSRASCAAKKAPDDLRMLMDATELPDNADYTHYRAKRERKRLAAAQYRAGRSSGATPTPADDGDVADSDGGGGGGGGGVAVVTVDSPRASAGGGNRRGRKHGRLEGQEEIVANRTRNIEVRKAKQAASHAANAAAQKSADPSRSP